MNSTRGTRWLGWLAAILLLAGVVAGVWLIGAPSPAVESVTATASPRAAVQYRMAQVKTATPPATRTAPQEMETRTPAPTPTLVPTLPAPPTSPVLASLAQVPRISIDVARAQVEMGTAVFVDVRTEATYNKGHLPGAISLPGGMSNSGYDELPDNRLLVFY